MAPAARASTPPPSARSRGRKAERLARFEEFLDIVKPIVDGEPATRTSLRTPHYAAQEAPSTPGTLQRPLPLTIAAGGPKGIRLAVEYGRNWVTIGPTGPVERTPASVLDAVRRQVTELDSACAAAGRSTADVGKVLLFMPAEPLLESADHFDDLFGPYAELGFDQVVLHHPAQTGPFGGDIAVFEQIAARHARG